MAPLSPGSKLKRILKQACFPSRSHQATWQRLYLTTRCTSASVLPSPSFLPAVFIEQLVARATVGEVNKMSEEMLSFIVSIMHNTPAL